MLDHVGYVEEGGVLSSPKMAVAVGLVGVVQGH
jgi:hypothetical protein